MPLTDIQMNVLATLAENPTEQRHLAGAAAIHMAPGSSRISHDLDLFHDSERAVGETFAVDRELLHNRGFSVTVLLSQPGFIRTQVADGVDSVLVEWAWDSAWRFMPPVPIERVGMVLHPVDLAINKVLALAGRNEPRDFLDTLYLDAHVLPLGALIWAAAGKDPGWNPGMLHQWLLRRGSIRADELKRLDLSTPANPATLREQWRAALAAADAFIQSRPPEESGCLYIHPESGKFFAPQPVDQPVLHRPSIGGVLPHMRFGERDSFIASAPLRAELESFFDRKVRGPR
jgi:hypothetical protein